ncbi:MAG: pyruvate kinase [Ignavibacteriales bacterium]|nr:pyruvate kinase [Ignavibacteriales bacterium]
MISASGFGKTKIICTIGPATQSVEMMVRLIEAGMDVARLNFSHGVREQYQKVIDNLKQASAITGEHITILQDLGGPKIRTGLLEQKSVALATGDVFTFTTREISGNAEIVSTTYQQLPQDIKIGDTILVDDGRMTFRVESTTETDVVCRIINGGTLSEKKGINLPGVKVSLPSFTEKDAEDLKFGLANDIDYVALSFVRSERDIRNLKEFLVKEAPKGKRIPIVAKIERGEAVEDINSIVAASDVIMVARGDLGVELPTEDVPIIQKMVVRLCNEEGVPVIVATQMLESMIESPRPTRAEANDVANAVLDGADAVMLSGETSVGKFPVEAVQTMDRIIKKAETRYRDHFDITRPRAHHEFTIPDAISRAACVMANEVGAKAIVVITHSGFSAINTAKYRPKALILAITGRDKILRRLNLVWGVRGIIVPDFVADTDTAFQRINEELRKLKYVQSGDYLIYTVGLPLLSRGTTNSIKIEKVV